MLNTTVGQLLVNDALPDDLRDHNRVLDKKGVHALLQQVGRQHPEKYREVSFALSQLGLRAAQDQGGMSFGMQHLRRSKAANVTRERIQAKLGAILADDNLTDQQRNDRIVHAVGSESEAQQKAVLEEAIAGKNPLAMQVLSGSRGKPMNLASLLASDMLYSDHRDEVIPIPVLRSYSEGLTPEEYWAGTYGARRGIIATKFATQEAGFLSKQLNQAGHRLVVMDDEGDDESPEALARGMIVDTDDMDNEGALLARDAGPYKRNTPLTPKILKQLKRIGQDRILVRSPLVGGSPEGGVYARDVGIRENGTLPGRGEQVGLQAAQALSEPISQGQLSAKHSGGVAGQEKAVGGFQYINQLIQTPKKMQGGAAHATLDGTVQRVEPAPAGGHYVTIGGEKHYVGEGFDLKVKKGDEVEAGDMISNGIPNPAIITQHKGVGEGRRYFVNEFRKAMASSGMQGHRRNIELLARGLINHVQMTEETDDNAPDDIVPYSTLEHTYKPREGHQRLLPKKALGQYLERPVLHYTIGTKVRPSMLKDFNDFGVQEIPVHRNPPPFVPHMVRGMYQLQHDPDWMTQMYGSGLKKSLLESVARGGTSEDRGTSFIPSLATGTDFGEVANRAVIQPKPAYALPKVTLPEPEPEPTGPTFFGGRFALGTQKRAVEATPNPPSEASASSAPSAPTAPPVAPPLDNNIMPTAANPQPPVPQPPPVAPLADATAGDPPGGTAADADWSRIHGSGGYQYNPPRTPQTPWIQQKHKEMDRQRWQMKQTQSYQKNYGTNPPPAVQTAGEAMGNTYAPPNPAAGGTPSPVPPPSTPAQAHADRVQSSRTFGDGPTQSLSGHRLDTPSVTPSWTQRNIYSGPADIEPQTNALPDSVAPRWNPLAAPAATPEAGEPDSAPAGDPANMPPAERSTGGQIFDTAMTTLDYAPALTQAARGGKSQVAQALGIRPWNAVEAAAEAAKATEIAAPAASSLGRGLQFLGNNKALRLGSKYALPIGIAAESVGVGMDVYDKGWDAKTDETAQKWRDILRFKDGLHTLYQAPMQVLSPVENAQMIAGAATQTAGGVKDLAQAAAGKTYDIATGTNAQSRAVADDKTKTQAQAASQQQVMTQERDQLLQQAQTPSLSPAMRQKIRGRAAEVDARINDTAAKSDAMNDETSNWSVSRFRRGMDSTVSSLSKQIAEQTALQQAGKLAPAQQTQLKAMQQQRDEYARLQALYKREVGYFSSGDFDDYLRKNVQGKKQQMVTLAQRMRDPALQRNPAALEQLKQEYGRLESGIQQYRTWAGRAK